jgi:hypothetical protein
LPAAGAVLQTRPLLDGCDSRRLNMLLSLSANPVPSELYQFFRGGTSTIALPWYVWGGGVYATKYDFDTSKYFGYLGTVSVPLAGAASCPVIVKSLRVTGHVEGKQGTLEGAEIIVQLFQRTGNLSVPIATVWVDRRNVVVTNTFINITQSALGFAATPSVHSLAIQMFGDGQGGATITGLFLDLQY